jgi:hypothetical protein
MPVASAAQIFCAEPAPGSALSADEEYARMLQARSAH